MKTNLKVKLITHSIFIIMTLAFLVPILMVIIVSFTNEADFTTYGFSFLPKRLSLEAYKYLFQNFEVIGRSILFTICIALLHPILSIAISAAMAYPLSQDDFVFKKPVYLLLLGTMFVNGGMMPTYMIYTQVYGLKDNPLIYLLSGLIGAWGVIVFRTFFKGVPKSLIESARIDGANHLTVLTRIVLPLSKPIVGINFFTGVVGGWNSWQVSLIYVTDKKYWTVQYFLQRILASAEEMTRAMRESGVRDVSAIPVETMRYAMCVFAVAPILLLFPKMQKYFAKGIAVGSVKE